MGLCALCCTWTSPSNMTTWNVCGLRGSIFNSLHSQPLHYFPTTSFQLDVACVSPRGSTEHCVVEAEIVGVERLAASVGIVLLYLPSLHRRCRVAVPKKRLIIGCMPQSMSDRMAASEVWHSLECGILYLLLMMDSSTYWYAILFSTTGGFARDNESISRSLGRHCLSCFIWAGKVVSHIVSFVDIKLLKCGFIVHFCSTVLFLSRQSHHFPSPQLLFCLFWLYRFGFITPAHAEECQLSMSMIAACFIESESHWLMWLTEFINKTSMQTYHKIMEQRNNKDIKGDICSMHKIGTEGLVLGMKIVRMLRWI